MRNFFKTSITTGINKSFDIGQQLGTGKFSVVRKGIEKSTGKEWALKIMKKSVVEENSIVKEIELMMEVKHPNVIQLYQVYESDSEIILVMELVTGGELFDRIVEWGSYTEEDASKLIHTLTKVIHYLHQKDIVHCDLKPENLLYADSSVNAVIKLCDFGLSQRCPEGSVLRSVVGTSTYQCPEIATFTGYGKPADMWSLGVILYILLCGYPPFDETTGYNLEFPSPDWDNISDAAKSLIKSLLVVDPLKRLTAASMLKNLWVVGSSAGKQSIIGTLRTLREFNTVRHTGGTTMGHNRTVRGTVFDLFSLNNSSALPSSNNSTPPIQNNNSNNKDRINILSDFNSKPTDSLDGASIVTKSTTPNQNNQCNNNQNTNSSSNNNSSSSTATVGGNIEVNNSKLNSIRICSSNSSSSGNLKEFEPPSTTFQDILKKQLMTSLEVGSSTDSSYDTEESSDTSSNLADSNERISMLSPEMLPTFFDSSTEKQKLLDQLTKEREENIRLTRELEELKSGRKLTSNNNLISFSLSSSLSASSNSANSTSSDNESSSIKKDKSKYGVDRMVSDLQVEFDKLFLSKETMEKLNSVMNNYKSKNQDKSVKLQLEKQKEKYKKLKLQLKKLSK